MMYVKFSQIDANTGISWVISQPISGPSWPKIKNLNLNACIQLDHAPLYYLGKIDNKNNDVIEHNPDNHFFVLTQEEYALELKTHIWSKLNRELNTISLQAANFRASEFQYYHDTAIIAGVYKYQQAVQYLSDSNADVPELILEANTRGVTPLVLANKIISNHESFKLREAKISGICGKIIDRIVNFNFNDSSPDESYLEFMSTEIIGTTTENQYDVETDSNVEIDVDVVVGKYSLSLPVRFKYE